MCSISDQIKFCSCLKEGEDKEIKDILKGLEKFQSKVLPASKEPFSWELYEFDRYEEHEGMIGLMYMPSDKIGFLLSEEFVLDELNNKNCFDFDYFPKEGDHLQINFQRNASWIEFLSFIYRSGKWAADFYGFEEHVHLKNYGIAKVLK